MAARRTAGEEPGGHTSSRMSGGMTERGSVSSSMAKHSGVLKSRRMRRTAAPNRALEVSAEAGAMAVAGVVAVAAAPAPANENSEFPL